MERLIGRTISREDFESLLDAVLHKQANPHDAAESVLEKIGF